MYWDSINSQGSEFVECPGAALTVKGQQPVRVLGVYWQYRSAPCWGQGQHPQSRVSIPEEVQGGCICSIGQHPVGVQGVVLVV